MTQLFLKVFKILDIIIPSEVILKETDYYKEDPSLTHISESLIKWNIKCMIVNLEPKYIKKIPLPAIVQKKKDTSKFDIITKYDNEKVILLNSVTSIKISITLEQYSQIYSSNTLLLEKIDVNYTYKQKRTQKFIYHIFFLLFFIYIFATTFLLDSFSSIEIILKIFALLLLSSSFLKENDISTTLFSYVCGNKNHCSDNSDKLKLFHYYSFSELGIIFFSSTVLSFFFINHIYNNNSIFEYLTYFIGIVLFIYSLYLQVFILKKFCRICLIVLLIFISDFALNFQSDIDIRLVPNLLFLIIIFISIFFIEILKKYFLSNIELRKTINLNKYVWRNKYLINTILENSKEYNFVLKNSILFGEKKAIKSCVLVISPNCKYCLQAFDNLLDLVMLNPQINLSVFVNSNPIKKCYYNLNKLARASLNNNLKEALEVFYNWRKYENNTNDVNLNNEIKEMINSNESFFEKNRFTRFPAIFINNKKIPEFIDFENIKIMFAR